MKNEHEITVNREAKQILDENLGNSEAKNYSEVIIGMQNLIAKLIKENRVRSSDVR
jgi:hypothetical protein